MGLWRRLVLLWFSTNSIKWSKSTKCLSQVSVISKFTAVSVALRSKSSRYESFKLSHKYIKVQWWPWCTEILTCHSRNLTGVIIIAALLYMLVDHHITGTLTLLLFLSPPFLFLLWQVKMSAMLTLNQLASVQKDTIGHIHCCVGSAYGICLTKTHYSPLK